MTGETTTPGLGASMWGSVGIITGANVVINAATFQFGGGAVNTPTFTIRLAVRPGLHLGQYDARLRVRHPNWDPADGTDAYITNNNFYNNFDSAMQIEPNGLLAGNPLTPLLSGHPFFRGNVMSGNGIDGLAVVTERSFLDNANNNLSTTSGLGRGQWPTP